MRNDIKIRIQPGEFELCRLAADAGLPAWAGRNGFTSITRTADELSVICLIGSAPASVRREAGWKLLKLEGPFEFSEIGILEGVLAPLAKAGVSIMAVSTYDTDYILVKSERLEAAGKALQGTRYRLEAG